MPSEEHRAPLLSPKYRQEERCIESNQTLLGIQLSTEQHEDARKLRLEKDSSERTKGGSAHAHTGPGLALLGRPEWKCEESNTGWASEGSGLGSEE